MANRSGSYLPTSYQIYFIEKHGFDEHDAGIKWVKLYFPNSFPLLQVKLFLLPTMSLAAENTFRIMLSTLMLLAKNNNNNNNTHRAIDRTGSSSNSNNASD